MNDERIYVGLSDYVDEVDSHGMSFDESDGEPNYTVKARVAKLDVRNANGVMIRSGALGKSQRVLISPWHHSSVGGNGIFGERAKPVADGKLTEDKGYLWLEAQYSRDIGDSLDEYNRLKLTKETAEWSLGYFITKTPKKSNGEYVEAQKIKAIEASPVVMGASPNTRTVKVDSVECDEAFDAMMQEDKYINKAASLDSVRKMVRAQSIIDEVNNDQEND